MARPGRTGPHVDTGLGRYWCLGVQRAGGYYHRVAPHARQPRTAIAAEMIGEPCRLWQSKLSDLLLASEKPKRTRLNEDVRSVCAAGGLAAS